MDKNYFIKKSQDLTICFSEKEIRINYYLEKVLNLSMCNPGEKKDAYRD